MLCLSIIFRAPCQTIPWSQNILLLIFPVLIIHVGAITLFWLVHDFSERLEGQCYAFLVLFLVLFFHSKCTFDPSPCLVLVLMLAKVGKVPGAIVDVGLDPL